MIFTNANRIRNIVRAVHQAGYEVPNVFLPVTRPAKSPWMALSARKDAF